MPLSTPISKAQKRGAGDAAQKALKAAHDEILKKNTDPFQEMDEEQVDDCIEELYCILTESSLEEFGEELEAGYCCTRDQLVYWLDKKYLDTTSYGEDLYNRLLEEDSKPTTEVVVEAFTDSDTD
jgi:hypothetical protein